MLLLADRALHLDIHSHERFEQQLQGGDESQSEFDEMPHSANDSQIKLNTNQ